MPGLKLWLLGPPRIELEDEPVELPRRKSLALLVYLALTGEAQPRDRLAALFYPEYDQGGARSALRRDLSTLNASLGPGWLDADRERIALMRDLDSSAGRLSAYCLDIDRFHDLLAACDKHDHPAAAVCPGCLSLLGEAVGLHRGDFLAGFTLKDSPEFDEWQFFQAESLRQELASALERLASGYDALGEGEASPGIPYARQWVALDPLHEPAHRQLMQLYARTGQSAAALRQYAECVRILDAELGVRPAEETTRLYEAIKGQRLLVESPAVHLPPRQGPAVRARNPDIALEPASTPNLEGAQPDATERPTFGDLLRRLRKRVGMSQQDLANATGYSPSLISALERGQRLPDIEAVVQAYLPVLGLQDELGLAAQLVESAARARGERPPAALGFKRARPVVLGEEAEAATSCMPAPPADILGREREIEQISSRLLGHHGRLLTLVGPPGVGKTRLALAVGAACQAFYRDGACFVPLAPVTDPALIASAVLSRLGVHDGTGKPPQARLIEHLRRKKLLLVLDNFEQLLASTSTAEPSPAGPSPAAALVAELWAECPGLRILVTSRERLHLRAEQRYRVQPLALDAAVDLFVERCAGMDSEFTLSPTNRPIIEAICQEVDRLPLALELCAGQIDLLSPSQLLTNLRAHRLEILVDGAQDLAPQHRTLRAAIGHSYALLDEDERSLFRSLGVFVGGCDLEAIQVVSAWNEAKPGRPLLPTLHALVAKSLVRAETAADGSTRYLLLETLREYALEQVRAAGEEALLRERHFAAYLQLFRTGDGYLRGPDSAAWLVRLEPEQDNLRGALQWALDESRHTDMAWLLVATAFFRVHTGHWDESARWLAQLLPHRGELAADLHLAFLIHVHAVGRAFNELQGIEPYTREMLGLLAVCPDKLLHAWAWLFAAKHDADFSEASAAWERSIACGRAAREEPGLGPEFGVMSDRDFALANPLRWYADRLVAHGEFARAAPLLAESTRIFQARGSRHEMVNVLGTAGHLALLQGDLARAQALLREAVTTARDFNYQGMLGKLQPYLARATLYAGDVRAARRLLADSLRVCLDLNDKGYLAWVCSYLAEAALWDGELLEAQQWLARSLAYQANPRRFCIPQTERLWLAARLATAQGDYLHAATLFGTAEAIRSHNGYEPVDPVRELTDAALAAVRAAVEPVLFAETFAVGRQLPLEEAFAAILLRVPHSSPQE